MKKHGAVQGVALKKNFGQHFLRDQRIVENICNAVDLNPTSSVFEIGCGDGFLTKTILSRALARLWVFEIDADWVKYVQEHVPDQRLTLYHENILDVDFSRFEQDAPWTLLANLPYQITFPILHLLQLNRHLLKEGVIMVQEEVAQKILKDHGRGYGYSSLFFQHYFDWQALDKIPPTAFYPPPKVFSRLLYFKPIKNPVEIPDEENFWKFVKTCFKQPRRTLKNNLASTHYTIEKIDEQVLALRSQQLDIDAFFKLWDIVRK